MCDRKQNIKTEESQNTTLKNETNEEKNKMNKEHLQKANGGKPEGIQRDDFLKHIYRNDDEAQVNTKTRVHVRKPP